MRAGRYGKVLHGYGTLGIFYNYSRTSVGLDTDGSFTKAISNSFLSPLEQSPIAADLG